MKILENVKKEHNLIFDCVSDYEIGQIYGDFKIIDIGKYVYKIHGRELYKPTLTIKCLKCGMTYEIKEDNFTKSEKECICNYPRQKKGGKGLIKTPDLKKGYIYGSLTVENQVVIFTGNAKPNTRATNKFVSLTCSECGSNRVIVKQGDFKRNMFTQCGCLTVEKTKKNGQLQMRKINEICNNWKILKLHHTEIKNNVNHYFYLCECVCCGEQRIIDSKKISYTLCKNKTTQQIK